MRCAVWYSNYGFPKTNFQLPYKAKSPTLYKKVYFETKKDIIDEIYRIVNEAKNKGFDIGESLFYQIPFFCDPNFLISNWCIDMITDYFTVKKYNVPLANCLHDVDPYIIDCFSIIDSELKNIANHEKKKNRS